MTETRATSRHPIAAIMVAAFTAVHCGKASSPTLPTGTTAVLEAVAASPSMAAGSSAEGVVTLTAAATEARNVSLASSNPLVAAVPATVTIPTGASTAAFTVHALSPGTAEITASMTGSPDRSATVTVGVSPELSAVSLSSTSVVGGESVTGTLVLTAPAPAGGAVVSVSASEPVMVPPTVTVLAGSTTATFSVLTRVVDSAVGVPISASYNGALASIELSVTPPTVATARFGVSGPHQTETCTLADSGQTLDCTFNGSTSRAPGTIVAWDWTWAVAGTFAQTTSGAELARPSIDCSLVPPPLPTGNPGWFTMTVTLRVHDSLGNVSAVAVNDDVRLIPRDSCGY